MTSLPIIDDDPTSKHLSLEVGVEAEDKRSSETRSGSLLRNKRYERPEDGVTLGGHLFGGKRSSFMWILCILVPIFYLSLVFGVIPIGNREHITDSGNVINGYWVFICLVNPFNMVIISYITSALFLSCSGVERPFRVHPIVLLSVFLIQIIVWILIIPFVGTFPFFGGCALALTYFITFFVIYFWEIRKIKQSMVNEAQSEATIAEFHAHYVRWIKVLVTFFLFFCFLVAYVYGYSRVSGVVGQKVLPFAMTILIFFVRKLMLGLTDHFPIEIAMFISGFWVENAYDMFQVMAYRSVADPVNYVSIWLTNALSILANLVFLTNWWFEFRIRIKEFLIRLFKCQPTVHLDVQADMEEIIDERGHSNNKPGYQRRQVRFLSLKLLSKMIAALFYVAISSILRYGSNKDLFPFSNDSERGFENSIIFSFANFGFLLLAAIVTFIYLRLARRNLLGQVFVIFNGLSKDRTFNGCVIALALHNGILAVLMMNYYNRIWYDIASDSSTPLS